MSKVRVLLVEDSLTIRRRLRDVLDGDPEIEVVAEAEDGRRAIALCQDLRPDVVSLDMILPVMSGLGATEYIMAHCPTPILVVSSSTNRGELFKTYDALAAGAVDVLDKPSGDDDDGAWERRYLSTLKLVSRIKVITHPRARLGDMGRILTPSSLQRSTVSGDPPPCRVVALGASTGGPGALVTVLRSIPHPLPVPVVLVLHIDEPFGRAFADWLDTQSPHRVVIPRDGDVLQRLSGLVSMARPDFHLVVRGGRCYLTSDPERHSCRPSIDALFESLALDCGRGTVAALLTGMGRDGAAGLLAIRQAGGRTIAQDESTSVVYGMPREAALLGAAERVLPLDAIGPAITALVKAQGQDS